MYETFGVSRNIHYIIRNTDLEIFPFLEYKNAQYSSPYGTLASFEDGERISFCLTITL